MSSFSSKKLKCLKIKGHRLAGEGLTMHAVSSIFSFKIVKFRHNISSKRIFLFVEYSID